jgi:hypothetical protein
MTSQPTELKNYVYTVKVKSTKEIRPAGAACNGSINLNSPLLGPKPKPHSLQHLLNGKDVNQASFSNDVSGTHIVDMIVMDETAENMLCSTFKENGISHQMNKLNISPNNVLVATTSSTNEPGLSKLNLNY